MRSFFESSPQGNHNAPSWPYDLGNALTLQAVVNSECTGSGKTWGSPVSAGCRRGANSGWYTVTVGWMAWGEMGMPGRTMAAPRNPSLSLLSAGSRAPCAAEPACSPFARPLLLAGSGATRR
jgi:hypothetical protein